MTDRQHNSREASTPSAAPEPVGARPIEKINGSYAVEKLKWLAQVRRDPETRDAAPLAEELALEHLNNKDARCDPGDELLAADLGVNERTIRRWRDLLIARGRMKRTKPARGRPVNHIFLIEVAGIAPPLPDGNKYVERTLRWIAAATNADELDARYKAERIERHKLEILGGRQRSSVAGQGGETERAEVVLRAHIGGHPMSTVTVDIPCPPFTGQRWTFFEPTVDISGINGA